MTVVTDPDSLNQGTEVVLSTASKTIQLLLAGNLGTDGVTMQCLYSFLQEEWNASATLQAYKFPLNYFTNERYEVIDGWDFADTTTRNLIRNGGWSIRTTLSGASKEEWSSVISLGSVGSSDQLYYKLGSSGSATNFVRTGAVNNAVKVYGDATHGDFDYRDSFYIYTREYQKKYAYSNLSANGYTTFEYNTYRFPLQNETDLKITHDDTAVSTGLPYTGMSITWYEDAETLSIGGVDYDFHVIIDGNGGTVEQIYEFVQWSLRQSGDIDAGAGTHVGKLTPDLLEFLGDDLHCIAQTEGGVAITNFDATDTSYIYMVDDTGATVTYPFVASLTIQIGENLKNDPDGKYRVFFTNDDAGDNAGYDFGTANAITVNDNDGDPMTGTTYEQDSITLSFDYDGNVQRGSGSDGEDAPITVVGIGKAVAQYTINTGTITRSTANAVALISSLERNYENE
jgi:hypothetical protein